MEDGTIDALVEHAKKEEEVFYGKQCSRDQKCR